MSGKPFDKPLRKITRLGVRRHLPRRTAKQNKSNGGRSLIVAGSSRYLGAAILAAQAASRVGSGYVTVASADGKSLRNHLVRHPDFLVRDFDSAMIHSHLESEYSAIAIGPGLGKKPAIRRLALRLIKKLMRTSLPVVLDADALNAIAEFYTPADGLFPSSWIMTPHEGELSRLLNISSQRIRNNRESSVRAAREKFGCTIVLKGDRTLIAGRKDLWVNTSGNSALAKAGTGDVLTGIIVGLLAQQVPAEDAAKLGVFLHGLQADRWVKTGNDHLSLMASDLVARLPKDLFLLRAR
ncbi:MAG: NAD(P)H-hydrate dehydratase [Deltaproteobacteria bacterium]|nr:NAD(P)H-hydrate dehydratase [Deltaproteobacteria bacterium]